VPLQEIRSLALNRNVENYFVEKEQATFASSDLVPGISASPDKMLQARLLAYQGAHRHRVGVNHGQLSVDAPRCPMHHYQRDGSMAGIHGNQDSSVNFCPNDNTHILAPDAACAPPPMRLANPSASDTMIQPFG